MGTIDLPPEDTLPATLIDLFDLLATRARTGNEAKNVVAGFLVHHSVLTGPEALEEAEFDTFCRLLNRNLVAGFGANTLKTVAWAEPTAAELPPPAKSTKGKGSKAKVTEETVAKDTDKVVTSPPREIQLDSFSCALGKPISPPFEKLFTAKSKVSKWYASRKLDGVRCLMMVDIGLPPYDGEPYVVSVQPVSRHGKPFTSLARLEDHLAETVSHFPQLREWLARDPVTVDKLGEDTVKRLVFDGEVCVMREMTKAEAEGVSMDHDDGSVGGSLWKNDGLVEDFPATVSAVMRKNQPVERPRYFLLDILPWCEFASHGPVNGPGLAKTFGQRIPDIQRFSDFLSTDSDHQSLVRAVAQEAITSRAQLDGMVERAANEGWEGLVIRADKPYNGKRSTDVYKFKQWLDAEYTVVDMETSKMRLSVGGVYGEHLACANVYIEHGGHRVSVGSGFSADQRLRYAKDPSAIVSVVCPGADVGPCRRRGGVGAKPRNMWREAKRLAWLVQTCLWAQKQFPRSVTGGCQAACMAYACRTRGQTHDNAPSVLEC